MKKAIILAIIASILWALVNPFIKHGLGLGFGPLNFAGLRFTIAGMVLLAYTWHQGMWAEVRQHWKVFLNLILLNTFLGYTFFYFGVDLVGSDISSIIMGTTPLVNVLLAHLIAKDDKLNAYKVLSLVVSLAGLLLIVGMGGQGKPLDIWGIVGILLLLAAIVVQCYSGIVVAEDKAKINPIFLNAVQTFFGGILLYTAGIAVEGLQPFWNLPLSFYGSLLVLVVVSIFAFSLWFAALQTPGAKVSDINMTRLINPILGAMLSWVMIAGESPSFATVAGMLIIVSSLLIYFKGQDIVRWIQRR